MNNRNAILIIDPQFPCLQSQATTTPCFRSLLPPLFDFSFSSLHSFFTLLQVSATDLSLFTFCLISLLDFNIFYFSIDFTVCNLILLIFLILIWNVLGVMSLGILIRWSWLALYFFIWTFLGIFLWFLLKSDLDLSVRMCCLFFCVFFSSFDSFCALIVRLIIYYSIMHSEGCPWKSLRRVNSTIMNVFRMESWTIHFSRWYFQLI